LLCCKLFEILVFYLINIVSYIAFIRRFGTEKEHQDDLDSRENDQNVEQPFPPKICRNRASNDGSPGIRRPEGNYIFETAASTKLRIDIRRPRSCTKYKSLNSALSSTKIPNRSEDNRLKCAASEPLNNAGSEKPMIIIRRLPDDGSNEAH
jgi:hypothetical protein